MKTLILSFILVSSNHLDKKDQNLKKGHIKSLHLERVLPSLFLNK